MHYSQATWVYFSRILPFLYNFNSFLLTTQEASADSIDQDQTAQNVQSDL